MAKTPFNAQLDGTVPFTVPAGKHAVFNASTSVNGSQLKIGSFVMFAAPTGQNSCGPFVATSNQQINSNGGGNTFFISGFLYDN